MTAVNYVEENSTRDVTQTEKKCSHEVAETPSLSGQIVKNLNFSSCLCELCGCFLKTRKVSELRFLSEAGSRGVNLKKTKPGNQGSFLGCSESFCQGTKQPPVLIFGNYSIRAVRPVEAKRRRKSRGLGLPQVAYFPLERAPHSRHKKNPDTLRRDE
jgi:hypothetical protein